MKPVKTYEQLAHLISVRKNSNFIWAQAHEDNILEIVKNEFPSGNGFDAGTTIDLEKSTNEKLVFDTAYHFMDGNGMYDGWEDYKVIVTPSLCFSFDLKIVGKNRDEIKDYISDVFWEALYKEVEFGLLTF